MPDLPLDETAERIIHQAVQEAYKVNHTFVGSPHLFLAFARRPDGPLAAALLQAGFSADGLRRLVRQSLTPGLPGAGASRDVLRAALTEGVKHTVQMAPIVAEQDHARQISERHLLIAFLASGLGSVLPLLEQVGLVPATLLAALNAPPLNLPPAPATPPDHNAGVFEREGSLNLALFDTLAQQGLVRAGQEAVCGRTGLGAAHLLVAWLEQDGGYLPALVSQQGHTAARLADALRHAQGYEWPAAPPRAPAITRHMCSTRAQQVLMESQHIAHQESAPLIGERHLLLAFVREGGGSSAQLLSRQGVNWSAIEAALRQPSAAPPRLTHTPLLDKLGRDVTEAARQGKLSPVVGRKRELEQIVHILIKDTKNNPLLVGEAGVGKTAVVEALAQHIVAGQVPVALRDKRLIELTLSSLLAGTRYRGDFEERLQRLMEEVRANAEILIFIDEIHGLVGAGDSGGTGDAANILKPALARGELHCIGATTLDEYQRTIAQDPALERRFQQVRIEEPTPEETLDILQASRARYETRYSVRITPEALAAAIRLSVQYFPEQRLPDKARDLLEEACARTSVGTMGQWGEPAAPADRRLVDVQAIAQIVAERKRLPVEQLTQGEQQRLLQLEARLRTRVIGQDQAVAAVARAVRLARTGLKEAGRPSGVFLFIGPTGVGKTELAKALAAELFGADTELTRFDMSEYMEPHSVAKLIGAPPGYVGYREEGQLVKELRRKPHSVVLIDEIEKAAPSIFDVFLQLFDEGRLTDAQGRQVDGRQAIYILTSNVGTELVGRRELGFRGSLAGPEGEVLWQEIQNLLRQTFRPEFLNRLDEIIVFQRLQREQLQAIAQSQIAALQARLQAEQGLRLEVTPEALALLCAEGFDETLGARPLRRAIVRLLTAPLSELLLTGMTGALVARVADGKISFQPA